MVQFADQTAQPTQSEAQKPLRPFVQLLDPTQAHTLPGMVRRTGELAFSYPFQVLRGLADRTPIPPQPITETEKLASLRQEFKRHSGAELVFDRADMAPGEYYDRLPPLSRELQLRAAEILTQEVKKYPPGFFKDIDLKTFGIFAACISNTNDGFHVWNQRFGGYQWYGLYNMEHGAVGAFYDERQLRLTFHHETFHAIDNNKKGERKFPDHYESDNEAFKAALENRAPYSPLKISAKDLELLKQKARGNVLQEAVSAYSTKEANEDQAETWRHVMTNLPDALIQAAERSQLPGSQRILHAIAEFTSCTKKGISVDWLVDVALERVAPSNEKEPLGAKPKDATTALLGERHATPAHPHDAPLLAHVHANPEKEASEAEAIIQRVMEPITTAKKEFRVRGSAPDAFQPNLTLQGDIKEFASAAYEIAALEKRTNGKYQASADLSELLGILDAYHDVIERDYKVSSETRGIVAKTRKVILELLPERDRLFLGAKLVNPHYMRKIDRAIHFPGQPLEERRVERNIRRVAPATVRVDISSGVCISPDGLIITNAHVAKELHRKMPVQFPNGESYTGVCTVFDYERDLAVVKLENVTTKLPVARFARTNPPTDTFVIVVGQPYTYDHWHVSTGKITEYKSEHPWKGRYPLGGVVGNWWTEAGNSGSAIFDKEGNIIALHNSWDENTRLRHGIPLAECLQFMKENKLPFQYAESSK